MDLLSPESHNSPGYNEDFEAPSPELHISPGYNEDFEAPSPQEVVDEKDEEAKTEFYDKVSMYYNYKYQYEEEKSFMKQRISYSPEQMTREEARKRYLKTKPKCINCGRNVGTLFSTEFRTMLTEDDFRRTLVAKCGDKESPCELDIQISMPFMTLFEDTIEPTRESINNYKKRIIRIKNDVMFGYMSEEDAIKRYTAIGELLKDDTKLLKDTLTVRENTTKEEQKRKQLLQAESILERDLDEFSRLTKEYKTTHNEQLLKDSTALYVDRILKTTRAITNIKYDYNEIEYDGDSNTFTLVQKQFPLDIQQNYSGEDVYETVIKFVKGSNTNNSNKLNKTIKKSKAASAAIAKNKPKTRKQKTRDKRIKEKLSGASSSETDSSTLESIPSVESPKVNFSSSGSE